MSERDATRPGARRWPGGPVQVAALVVAAAVGLMVLGRHVGAQPQQADAGRVGAERSSAGGAAMPRGVGGAGEGGEAGDGGDGGGGGREASGSGTGTGTGGRAGDGGVGLGAPGERDAGGPLDYAVIQTEQDIDPSLSEEQRRAVGTGLVPIHREGRYRSPLAHPRFGAPATVRVGLVLNAVREYDIRTGAFSADFFVSLTGDRPMPALELSFSNGHDLTQQVLVDTPTFKAYRYSGSFSSAIDLRRYPFDLQALNIEIEDLRAGVDQIVFVADPDRTALDEGFSVPGWNVSSLGARTYRHLYPSRFDRDDLYVSRYKFELGIERFGTSAAFSVFIPALIIILISLTGLWMPFAQLEVRSNTGAPMLAAAVLFHYSLIQALPPTGYLTRADKVMLGVYLSLLLNMLSTWAFFIVSVEQRDRVFRLGRSLVPPTTLVIMTLSAVL